MTTQFTTFANSVPYSTNILADLAHMFQNYSFKPSAFELWIRACAETGVEEHKLETLTKAFLTISS